MNQKPRRYGTSIIVLLLALAFVAKFGRAAVLKTYIELGIGDCKKIPILCVLPEAEIINPQINKEYLAQLTRFEFPEMEISLPKDFSVIKERINKVYYKRNVRQQAGAVAYLLYEKPNFFIGLFPNTNKQGIKNDYEFISRTMHATTSGIDNLTDTFFAVMKTVFTPDLGDEKNVRIAQFTIGEKKGFVTYNLNDGENYFDCNIVNSREGFFKVYIKDRGVNLDLDKVLAIISTVKFLGRYDFS